jgi:hypothetical protein
VYEIQIQTDANIQQCKQAAHRAMLRKGAGLTLIGLIANPYEIVDQNDDEYVYRKTAGKEVGTHMNIGFESQGDGTIMTFYLGRYQGTRAAVFVPRIVIAKDDLRNYARVAARVLRKGGHQVQSQKVRI